MSFNQSVTAAFSTGINTYSEKRTPSNGTDLPKRTWNNHVRENYGNTRKTGWDHTKTMQTLSKSWSNKN
jgi:hypothetical protein